MSVPRRQRLDLLTPAERAIYDAMLAVEAAGASEALTEAVTLLGQARDLVADHVEAPKRWAVVDEEGHIVSRHDSYGAALRHENPQDRLSLAPLMPLPDDLPGWRWLGDRWVDTPAEDLTEQSAPTPEPAIRSGYPTAEEVETHDGPWVDSGGVVWDKREMSERGIHRGPFTPVRVVPCEWPPTPTPTRDDALAAAREAGLDVVVRYLETAGG